MIVYKQGNILTSNEKHIAHGCNCRGSFGYGIAGQIANKFPEVKEAYLKKHQTHGWKLGEVQIVNVGDKTFYNCATQYYYGNPAKSGKKYASYDAIELVMRGLYQISKNNNTTIAMPKIGSKLGGLDWLEIEKIINKIFHDIDVTVYEYNP